LPNPGTQDDKTNTNPDEGGGGGGIIVFLLLLIISGGVGGFFYKKKKDKERDGSTFAPLGGINGSIAADNSKDYEQLETE